jgi:septal ring factor EnvC (AmiA/AmiB activator)
MSRRVPSDECRVPSGRAARLGAVLLLLCVFAGDAQTNRNADLDRLRGEIARMRGRLEELHTQAQTAERELEEVDVELGIRSRELDVAMHMEADLEQQQKLIQEQIAGLTPKIQQQKRFLRQRLSALYRLGGLSYVRLLLSLDDRRDPIEAMSMLTYLVSRDSRAISHFDASRQQLTARYADLADRQRRLGEIKRIVEQRRADVAAAHAEKARMLASLQKQGSQSERQLADLEEKARRLERLIDVLSRQKAGLAPPNDIHAVQGALGWPVSGKVIEGFGRQRDPKFSTVTFNNGVKIAATAGAEVHAVFAGTVLFSQWFKGYGNLIIVDHGNRVVSLYGNLKSPAVSPGDRVNAGQAIAGVGESEDAQLGYLYFEIRQDNKPEDPQKWLR